MSSRAAELHCRGMSNVTCILNRARQVDPRAAAELLPSVSDGLRRLDMRRLAREKRAILPLLAMCLLICRVGALAGTHTWVGSNSQHWSDPLNWIGGAPSPGEVAPVKILIPASAPGFQELTNDVPGLVINELIVAAHANTLHGAPGVTLRLKDGTLAGLGNSTILSRSFALQLEGQNHLQGSNDFVVRGPITESEPGAGLEVSGNVRLETSSKHSGPTSLSSGIIYLLGSLTNTAFIEVATNATVTLAADFTILTNRGLLHIAPEAIERPETSRLFGQGFVSLPTATNSVMMIDYPALDSDDPADGGRLHSRLVINGPVVLAGQLEAITDLSQDGLRFGIIEKIGSALTLGQFEDLPEGALMRVTHGGLLTQRVSYQGGAGENVTATFVAPPAERRLAGPFLLENGWLQILAGTAEFEESQWHRWEANQELGDSNGWAAVGPDFRPVEQGTILTITNITHFPNRFFRLTRR